MGKSKKGAKHLTDLTLGIDGIKQALEEAKKLIEEQSEEIGKTFAKNIEKNLKSFGVDPSKMKAQNQDFDKMASSVQNANEALQKFTKTTLVYDGKSKESRELVKRITSVYLGLGKTFEITEERIRGKNGKLSDDFEKVTTRIINDEKKRADEIKKAGKEKENAIKKEIQLGQRRKRQAESEQKSIESSYESQISKLDRLVSKQKDFVNKLNRQKPGVVDKETLSDAETYLRLLERIQSDTKKSGKVTEQQANQVRILKDKTEELSDTYDKMKVREAQNQTFLRDAKAEEEAIKRQISLGRRKKQEVERAERAVESSYQRQITGIDSVIKKQKSLLNTLKSQKPDERNQGMIEDGEKYLRLLNRIKSDAEQSGKITSQQINQAEILSKKVLELLDAYDKLNAERKSESATKKEEADNKKQLDNLTTLIRKQKEFISLVSRQKTSPINKQIISSSEQYLRELEEINAEASKNGRVTEQQADTIRALKNKLEELTGVYQEAGTKGDSFLKKITDKAKWVSAFYIVDALKQGLQESAVVIKETEDAAIELQRVLKENLGQAEIVDELYKIAYQYGRDFQDVQEVAVKFTQAGYSWNEVLELTKSTMLALNTAELDVTESTEGLIAITSQWNIGAHKMEETIDKINVTADRFPVTSEKIVSALQRTSSSAKNAGLSIDETIGAITALSKATGRSGENIGTALNSLLIYTSKPKALETFYEVGNQAVKDTVDSYKAGVSSILDVWKALSANLKIMSEEQKNIIYQGIGGDEFAQHLEESASVITDDIKKIYGSAGTFRQNYLTALLDDIGTVDEVTTGMNDALGYSAEENKKYMDSLSASLSQFKTVMKELAVQTGEGAFGLKNLFVVALDTGIALGKLTKFVGGVVNVAGLLLGIGVKIKAQKLNEKYVVPLTLSLGRLKYKLNEVKTKMSEVSGITNKVKVGFQGLRSEFKKTENSATGLAGKIGKLQIAISLLRMGYSAISNAIRNSNDVEQERRTKAIEGTKATLDESKNIEVLYNQFKILGSTSEKTAEQQKRFEMVTYSLAEKLNIASKKADGSAKSFAELATEIEKTKNKILEMTEVEWDALIRNLTKDFERAFQGEGLFGILGNSITLDRTKILSESEEIRKGIEEIFKGIDIKDHDGDSFFAPSKAQDKKFYEASIAAKEYIETLGESGKTSEITESIYDELVEVIEKLGPAYQALTDVKIHHQISVDRENDALPKTVEEYENYRQALIESISENEAMADIIGEMVDSYFPALSDSIEQVSEGVIVTDADVQTLSDSLKGLGEQTDNFQSSLDAVYDVMQEYNEQGFLTVDMVQKLISAGGEYVSLLEFTENGIRLNEDATGKLIDAQRTNVLEMVKLAAATDICKTAQKYLEEANNDTEAATNNFSDALGPAGDKLAELTAQALEGAIAMNEFGRQAAQALGGVGKEFDSSGFISEVQSIGNAWKGVYDQIRNGFGDIEHYSSSAAKAATDAVRSSTNAQKKYYEEQKKAVRERYEAEKKELEKLKDAVRDRYDAEKERLEEQKEAIKDKYDAQIEALRDVQKENDRLDKQEDYIRNKRKAQEDIERAASRSGVEYREQEQEARENLQGIEDDWKKTKKDWAIEDQIKALEKKRDAEIEAIEDKIKANEKAKELELKAIDEKLEKLEEEKDAQLKAIDDMIAANSAANATMAGNYKTQYIEPSIKNSKTMATEVSKYAIEKSNETNKILLENAKTNARMISEEYKKAYVFTSDYGKINGVSKDGFTSDSGHFGTPRSASPFSSGGSSQSTTNNYNTSNSTRNSTVYANVFGERSAKGLGAGLFTNP